MKVRESDPKRINKEIRLIQDELSYIGRYLQSISPKVERYKELQERQKVLRKKLKEINGN